ncbi:hypothetical protein OUHCRE7_29450 [Enterobacter hormaechei subsp. hoffmannii]
MQIFVINRIDPPGGGFATPGNYIQTLRYFPTQDKALGEADLYHPLDLVIC